MSDGPYRSCSTSKDTQPYSWGIEGPGNGLGFRAWYLYPENTFPTPDLADQAARMMNLAFAEGQKARSAEIRSLLAEIRSLLR